VKGKNPLNPLTSSLCLHLSFICRIVWGLFALAQDIFAMKENYGSFLHFVKDKFCQGARKSPRKQINKQTLLRWELLGCWFPFVLRSPTARKEKLFITFFLFILFFAKFINGGNSPRKLKTFHQRFLRKINNRSCNRVHAKMPGIRC
jgi:hypothetical protein